MNLKVVINFGDFPEEYTTSKFQLHQITLLTLIPQKDLTPTFLHLPLISGHAITPDKLEAVLITPSSGMLV